MLQKMDTKYHFYTYHMKQFLKTTNQHVYNTDFINDEIERLLQKGCISWVTQKPLVVNLLTEANNSGGKLRLVLDARHINPHMYKFKHKYEDATTARQLFNRGGFIFSYDLKSAYHHLNIFPADRQYLGFQWENQQYNVLPDGLATTGIFSVKL